MKKKTLNKKTLEQKLSTHFGVKIAESTIEVKADEDSRTIKAIGNTYFLIDSDQDMLIPGVSAKSIADRGPESNATAKIKHQADHVLNTKNAVGRITVLDERKIDGLDVLYFESKIPNTVVGNDHLENYKDMVYDNHSIGFRYKDLALAVKNGTTEEMELWAKFLPLAINPEKAEDWGYFYVIKEIELFEISVVSFGANQLTANLGGKSKESNNKLKTEMFERLDTLKAQLKSNADAGKDERKTIDLEFDQLKQIITELNLVEPSKKDTTEGKPSDEDTDEGDSQPINFKQSIIKNL